MKKHVLILCFCIAIGILATGCGQIDQAGVALVAPALSPAPPTATPIPITPTAPPVTLPLATTIPPASSPINAGNVAQITELAALDGSIGPLTRLTFNAAGDALAASDYEGGAMVWHLRESTLQTLEYPNETTTNEDEMRASPPGRIPYGAMHFLSNGHELMVFDSESIRTWRLTDNTLVVDARLSDGGNFMPNGTVTLNTAGTMMARGGQRDEFNNYREGMTRIWDITGENRPLDLEGHSGWIEALAFNPGSTLLATVGTDHRLLLWDTEDATATLEINAITRRANDLQFSPDGTWIASGDSDGNIRIWDAGTGDLLADIHTELPIARIDFDPTGALIAGAHFDRTVHIWDATSGTLLHTLPSLPNTNNAPQSEHVPIPSVVFSPDGMLLATLDRENTVHLWGLP